ncbi:MULTISPECIES: hypothetical protein [unclassified Paenibacillus]|uniref:hypothetical protein n=1 Tax=unclassified Paenibacillus TaxID=185978 RepID=UPI0009A7D142|nr:MULTISPECIES: hypothetical protein [unclassified Paenibacillus]SLK13269.1 hypothetical protein SAMN06272722_108107 [Paenibacillus sp. RU5A]SOC72965.1 hypothetical protein SAMN05880581_108107 [Paenibacillus sp. RU26A]SOC75220.1 hypothetical protein SAMN05880586_108107 [Paenibacillus sp. RU5M]
MKSVPISILLASVILGVSFIVGCLLLSNQGRASESTQAVEQDVPNNNKTLMTIQETAEYLSMTKEQVMDIIKAEQGSFSASGFFEGKMFPFIKVQDQFLVSRIELELWAQDASSSHRRYINGQMY